jgi:ribose 5-phosphate isomerase A
MYYENIARTLLEDLENDSVVSIGLSSKGYDFEETLVRLAQKQKKEIYFIPSSSKQAILLQSLNARIASLNNRTPDIALFFSDYLTKDGDFSKIESYSVIRDKIVSSYAQRVFAISENEPIKKINETVLEISKFGWKKTLLHLSTYGLASLVRKDSGIPFLTDSNHYLALLKFPTHDYEEIAQTINLIPGVLENALFIDTASDFIILEKNKMHFYDFEQFQKAYSHSPKLKVMR